MLRVALRRSSETSASPDEAASLVSSLQAAVINRSGQNMLVDFPDHEKLEQLRTTLPGWLFFPQQTPKVPLPDTRLKIGEAGD